MSASSIFLASVAAAGCTVAWVFLAAWKITGSFPLEPEPDDEEDF